tara:strand:+ start:49 stop:255 length:207 start_codon:yes stop_codon:yes gene_type:complete
MNLELLKLLNLKNSHYIVNGKDIYRSQTIVKRLAPAVRAAVASISAPVGVVEVVTTDSVVGVIVILYH